MCTAVSFSPRSGVWTPVLVFEVVRRSAYPLRQDSTRTPIVVGRLVGVLLRLDSGGTAAPPHVNPGCRPSDYVDL